MKELSAEEIKNILGYAPKSKEVLLEGILLIIPVKARGILSTIELIDCQGRKAALAGRGSKSGGYWSSGELPGDTKSVKPILIGEGVATVVAAAQATGYLAIAVLSSSNLISVAKQMRERFGLAKLIILADLVKSTKEPDSHAVEAAKLINGVLVLPDFGEHCSPQNKDFNDMANLLGREAVKHVITEMWPIPQSILAAIKSEPYPLDALPEIIRAAVEEVQNFVKAPVPLVASSALASLSLAIQAQVDTKRAERLVGPSSLFLLTIADSGERKSTCDNFFSEVIHEYDRLKASDAKPEINKYSAAIGAWQEKCSGIKEKIRKLAKDGKPTEDLESDLHQLENDKPVPPRIPRLMYSDTTPEALAYSLAKSWPSGGILSAEAGIVFGGHSMNKDSIMRNLALLNVLWDGGSVQIDRRTQESFVVRGVRLTIGLQIQAETLRNFFDRSGSLARGTGFLARFLISKPESTQGYRLFSESPINWSALDKFNNRVRSILEKEVPIDENNMLSPHIVSLSDEAKVAWISFYNEIEQELSSGGELYEVRDVASKIAENAARLALIFHKANACENEVIGIDSMISATRIAAWHLSESRRFFGELALSDEVSDLLHLDRWIVNYCQKQKTNILSRRDIQRNVTPSRLREKTPLDKALNELQLHGRVRIISDGKRKEIHVNPAILSEEQ